MPVSNFGQGCILSPCLINLQAEHIIRKTGLVLDEEVKIGGRNINHFRYADDTLYMLHWRKYLLEMQVNTNECFIVTHGLCSQNQVWKYSVVPDVWYIITRLVPGNE